MMGEDSIRGKLGNSRIGVAITADIRPLNHLALKPYSCPILPGHPCLFTSSSCAGMLLSMRPCQTERAQSHTLFLKGLIASLLINQALFSHGTKAHKERSMHYIHCLDQGLVLLILQRASLESLKAVGCCACVLLKTWQKEIDLPPYIPAAPVR